MKNLILILCVTILFIACSAKKEIVIDITKPSPEVIESIKEKVKVRPSDLSEDSITKLFSEEFKNQKVYNIAVVYPSKLIGKYAKTSVDTITGYFLYRNVKVNIETFDSINQDEDNISDAFLQVVKKDFDSIISLYPVSSLNRISNLDFLDKHKIYFPLVLKKDADLNNDNFIYGAISYEKQINKLQTLTNNINMSIYEKSFIGNKLNAIYEKNVNDIIKIKSIKKSSNSFKRIVKDKKLNGSTLMLNTSIIKSSIILSQLRVYDIIPSVVLSTQLNYNPLIVSLTQFEDRMNLITANSIEKVNDKLEDIMSLLDIDIKYNWVNYSILVGVNYLYDKNEKNIVLNEIVNNEVIYTPKFYRATSNGFELIEE